MKATREDIIDLRYKVEAVLRKAQCRAVNCEVIDGLAHIAEELSYLDDRMTEIIGD
jgi:hypothetical protein